MWGESRKRDAGDFNSRLSEKLRSTPLIYCFSMELHFLQVAVKMKRNFC
jgi:hypothetical protein